MKKLLLSIALLTVAGSAYGMMNSEAFKKQKMEHIAFQDAAKIAILKKEGVAIESGKMKGLQVIVQQRSQTLFGASQVRTCERKEQTLDQAKLRHLYTQDAATLIELRKKGFTTWVPQHHMAVLVALLNQRASALTQK